jgi:hypothetical protein
MVAVCLLRYEGLLRATGGPSSRQPPGGRYQACPAPQCGQRTVVETFAWNSMPQAHE